MSAREKYSPENAENTFHLKCTLPLYRHPAIPPEGMMLVPVELLTTLQSILVAGNFKVETYNEGILAHILDGLSYPVLQAVPAKGEQNE